MFPSGEGKQGCVNYIAKLVKLLNTNYLRITMRKIIQYKSYLKKYARSLRNGSTLSEIELWKALRAKEFYGYKFIRQKPLLEYIADFYCYELDLVIELDGYTHQFEETQERDIRKDEALQAAGLTVLRFTDDEVLSDIGNVLAVIKEHIDNFEESS